MNGYIEGIAAQSVAAGTFKARSALLRICLKQKTSMDTLANFDAAYHGAPLTRGQQSFEVIAK